MSSSQLPGKSYLDASGQMSVPSPYESTAAPGTNNPFSLPPSAVNSGQGVNPPQPAPGTNDAFGGATPALSSGLGGFGGGAASYFSMIGDASPPIGLALPAASHTNPPKPPPPGARSIAPSVRGFKFSENQSPMPQDRIYFNFNYYNNVNAKLDKFFQTDVKGINIYRYIFGYEKTFNKGMGSIGFRLPLDNIFALSSSPTLKTGGASTGLGDFSVYFKHVIAFDRETGSLASSGVAISPQVASGRFAGAQYLNASNTTTIQPFFAFLLRRDRLYFQGFIALDVPTNYVQPTLLYNDYGIGYFVYRDDKSDALITAVAPTFEVHINTPVNHTNAYSYTDKFATPDIVNLTLGLNTRIRQNSILTMGAITPVTGPRPFSVEATVLFNYYFGRSARAASPPNNGG